MKLPFHSHPKICNLKYAGYLTFWLKVEERQRRDAVFITNTQLNSDTMMRISDNGPCWK